MLKWPTYYGIQRVLNRLLCRFEEKNVMANEIAGFGGLNLFSLVAYLEWN